MHLNNVRRVFGKFLPIFKNVRRTLQICLMCFQKMFTLHSNRKTWIFKLKRKKQTKIEKKQSKKIKNGKRLKKRGQYRDMKQFLI